MGSLALQEFHQTMGASFLSVNGEEAAADYGEPGAEFAALAETAGVMDCSYRARLCVLGEDRAKFLNGQVTNNVKDLRPGEGCHAALVSAKGKIQSDLHIYILQNEILLDLEPGMGAIAQERLEKYVIAEDVQLADVSAIYGLWSVQGPKAAEVLGNLPWNCPTPEKSHASAKIEVPALGELYVINRARTRCGGFDLYAPAAAMPTVAGQLAVAAAKAGGRFCGWNALETARIEAGIPRFGADMDDTNLVSEALDTSAISYSKGCYIGQEVIARVRTYGQVAKALRGLRLPDTLKELPRKGDKLFLGDKEAGYITSATASPRLQGNIALGYVRREANAIGTDLLLHMPTVKVMVRITELPFV